VVEPGPGDDAVGIVVLANDKGEGFECVLGGTGRMRGFMLRDRQSRVLWSDEWAPWQVYEPAIIEIVVESGRLRCQLIHWDGTELVSQSEWVKIDSDSTNKPGHLGLMTEGGIARFWGWEIADDPLMAMTPNAPNKLRLTGGADSMWVLNGGDWRWSDRKRDAVVQAATVERAWVYHKGVTGKHRPFSCQVEVERGAGGAGMVFQGRGPDKPGLLAWLGGRPGEGSLMLYTLKTDGFNAEWSSPGGLWRFDIPYILVGQTKPGHARVQLLDGDGNTSIVQSPWIEVPAQVADQPGMIGFHTWRGSAIFSDFLEPNVSNTSDQLEVKQAPTLSAWSWERDPERGLTFRGEQPGELLNRDVSGTHGTWRCKITPGPRSSSADLLVQTSPDYQDGFACRIETKEAHWKARLIALPGRILWTSPPKPHEPGTTYVVEAVTTLDRIRMKVVSEEGEVLADSDYVYVSDRHNERVGYIGARASGDRCKFSDFSFEAE
jgi:hypothetical protein